MRRTAGLALLLVISSWAADAQTLRYPEELAPLPDTAENADVRVRLSVDEAGAVRNVKVLASTRPERDAEVIAALEAWRFPPARNAAPLPRKPAGWTREKRFAFAAPGVAPSAPRFSPSPEWMAWVPDPGSAAQDAGYVPLPNEMWVAYPEGFRWSGRDPEVRLAVAAAVDGSIAAARIADAAVPALGKAALDYALARRCERPCFSWPDGSRPAPVVVDVPVRFYTPAVRPKDMKPPAYPPGMLRAGIGGQVQIVFTVAADGSVHDVQVLGASHPDFERVALDSVLQTRFKPALRFGKPAALRNWLKYTYRQDGTAPEIRPYAIGSDRPASSDLPATLRYEVAPKVTLAIPPVYPLELALQGITGSANVFVGVDPDGEVSEARVLEASQPAFGQALQAAMEAWRFDPARRKDGETTWAAFHNEQRFSLSDFFGPGISADAQRILRALKAGGAGIVDTAALDAPLQARFKAQPVYPRDLLQTRIGGRVRVEFFVDRNGGVQWPHVLSADNEALGWAAITAVARWRFDPPTSGGKPVDTKARVQIEFVAPNA
ncbi:MAG: TonB family protein [Solimonas sp.]